MVGAEVGCPLEPEARRLGQNLTLEGHRGQNLVESRLPVGRDHDAAAVRQVVGIPHLAPLKGRKFWNMGVGQDTGQGLAVVVGQGCGALIHGAHYKRRIGKGEG